MMGERIKTTKLLIIFFMMLLMIVSSGCLYGCKKVEHIDNSTEDNKTSSEEFNDSSDTAIEDLEEPIPTNSSLSYTLDVGLNGYIVTGIGNSQEKEIKIENNYADKPVIAIGANAFKNNSRILSVYIPSNVTKISDYAFLGCTKINHVEFQEGSELKEIGDKAFARCENLEDIVLPNKVETIGKEVFCGCASLSSIYAPDSINVVKEDILCDTLWWEKASAGIVYLNKIAYGYKHGDDLDGCLFIKEGIKIIPDKAFSNTKEIIEINLPKDITYIGTAAFSNCNQLSSIKIHENNTAYQAVDNCLIMRETQRLILGCKNSIIPDNILELGDYCFYGAIELADIELKDSIRLIGKGAFKNCSSFTPAVLTLPKNLQEISQDAFKGCAKLNSVVIDENVINICPGAFDDCTSLRVAVIKSPYVLAKIARLIDQGGLIFNADIIYLDTDLSVSNYIDANYAKQVESDKPGYYKYTKIIPY
jgi:hypothetical protein